MMTRTLVLTVVVALAGCATGAHDNPQTAGQPAAYREGYAAGCDSGYVAAGHPYYQFRKDVSRFASDQLYGQGWNDGFAVCKGSYESTQRSLRR
jgi:hypothetical protein